MFRVFYNVSHVIAHQSSMECQISKRFAGHSKWANIKHTKMAKDQEKNKLFTRLSKMLRLAVIEGKSSDPNMNLKLYQVVEQCKRACMPSATITSSIKSASASKSAEVSSMLYLRGPSRCSLLIEVSTSNTLGLRNNLAAVMKKFGFKYDQSVNHDYTQKGLLTCNPIKVSENLLDEATEHAIEGGAEEVTFDEETKKLIFECSPERTMKAREALTGLGYTVDSAVVEFIPVVKATLSDEHLELVSKFLEKIESWPEILNITDNIE